MRPGTQLITFRLTVQCLLPMAQGDTVQSLLPMAQGNTVQCLLPMAQGDTVQEKAEIDREGGEVRDR